MCAKKQFMVMLELSEYVSRYTRLFLINF